MKKKVTSKKRTTKDVSQADSSIAVARLSGKTALITGGNRGLGLSFAKALAGEGCAVIITGRDDRTLSASADELSTYGVDVLAHYCDVRDERSVTNLFKTVREQFGSIDILINNAG